MPVRRKSVRRSRKARKTSVRRVAKSTRRSARRVAKSTRRSARRVAKSTRRSARRVAKSTRRSARRVAKSRKASKKRAVRKVVKPVSEILESSYGLSDMFKDSEKGYKEVEHKPRKDALAPPAKLKKLKKQQEVEDQISIDSFLAGINTLSLAEKKPKKSTKKKPPFKP
jgi:colicin import membrane protein